MNNDAWCYVNGTIRKASEATVSIFDIGMLRGYGIYEGIKVYGTKPFRLADHLARFKRSAKALGLTIPESDERIREIIVELAKKNGFRNTNIRIILTGGNAIGGIEFDPNKPTFYIIAEESMPLPQRYYEEGCHLVKHEHQRFMPEFKTVHYITAVNLQPLRKEKAALEILYHSDGKILEASTSNFMIFKGDTLITPKDNILHGITRKAVLELAQAKFNVEERDLHLSELPEATEVLITASYKEIVPVVTVDDLTVGDGKPGNNTRWLMEQFAKHVDDHNK
jgi:branched-chain amino acid aminotransferase